MYILVQLFSLSILRHKEFAHSYLSLIPQAKACGPDGIPTRLLKELAYNVASVLALIFNASLTKANYRLIDWKSACHGGIPVFKKGSRTNPSNYRPISLTCVCCKIFEHIISSAISKHANLHNIICIEQHGRLRKHRSCKTQLLSIGDH